MCPRHQQLLHVWFFQGNRVMAIFILTLCGSAARARVFPPPSCVNNSPVGGTVITREGVLQCVFTAHMKASKVFHWAGQPGTLPKDLHWGSREALLVSFPAVAIMGKTCCHGDWGGGKQLCLTTYKKNPHEFLLLNNEKFSVVGKM